VDGQPPRGAAERRLRLHHLRFGHATVLTEAVVASGLLLTRLIFKADLRKDVKAELQASDSGGEFNTVYRLLDNTSQAIGGSVAWAAGVVIVVIPWSVFGTVFRATNPTLSSAIADIGSGVVGFAVAGFCLYLLRMGLVVSLAQREAKHALRRAEGARSGLGSQSSMASPSRLDRLALVVTKPSDFDLVVQAAVSVLVVMALIDSAHTRGFPL
jgi:hypothetical protein